MDKTGTITEGKPAVEKIGAFGNTFSESDILKYIVSLNSNSEHPLAEATVSYGKEQNAKTLKVDGFSAVTCHHRASTYRRNRLRRLSGSGRVRYVVIMY